MILQHYYLKMNKLYSLFIALVFVSCTSLSPDAKEADFKNLSYSEGLKIYQTRCSVCHGEKGEGFKELYPPVANSDYMLKHKNEIPCIIKHGLEGEIIVNGKTYNSKMISHSDLSPMEIADVMTFLLNSWEMGEGDITPSDVKKMLKACE